MVDLERLVTEQPLRERFVDLLMRALYLAGRQAEALRAFQRFRDYLAEETGLLPSDALVLLEQRITVGDPSLAPMATEAVPGYELAEVIGEGSFGSVYRAVQPSVGREVAVKVVRPELADDPRFVQRFEAEAQLVARIEHPHVVPLYDYWRRPGGAFLVFRLLRGGSLAEREAEGAVDLDAVSRLVDEVGGALAAAHALGVVHRDVKPANILFDEAGNSYLADFGIAERDDVDEDLDLRSAGSPLYASPEQIRDATASSASDQYALAVVAWEALSGRAPFGGSSVTEVGRVKFVDPVPPLDAGVDRRRGGGPRLGEGHRPAPGRPLRVCGGVRGRVADRRCGSRPGPHDRRDGCPGRGPVGGGDPGQPGGRRRQPLQGPALVPGGRRGRVLWAGRVGDPPGRAGGRRAVRHGGRSLGVG